MLVRPSVRAQQLQEGVLSSFSLYGRPGDIPSISDEATDRCSSAALEVAVIPLAKASSAGCAVLGDTDGSETIIDEVETASAVQLDSSQSEDSVVEASATMPVVAVVKYASVCTGQSRQIDILQAGRREEGLSMVLQAAKLVEEVQGRPLEEGIQARHTTILMC